jgi:hypothetical protein
VAKRSKDNPPPILNPTRPAEKRINSIVGFTRRQRHGRRWINFHDIAEWYAKHSGRLDAAELDLAYDMLQRDLFFGDFEEGGRSLVLYLNPNLREERRMTRAFLQKIARECTDQETVRHHLSWCWIPRHLYERWLASHRVEPPPWMSPEPPKYGLPPSPARFEPTEPQSRVTPPAPHATPGKQGNRRRGPARGTVDRYGESDRALFPDMKRLIQQHGSANAAARHLAFEEKISGKGTEENRARRLARRYLAETR